MHPCKSEFRSPNKLTYMVIFMYEMNGENIEKNCAFDMNNSIFLVVCILLHSSTIG